MKYNKWSLKEKLEIIEQVKEFGVIETCRKFSVSTGNYYNWRKKFEQKGEAGLKTTYQKKSKELREVEEENRVLRKLLSDREIELEVQRELLKKVWDQRSKKNLVDIFFTKYKCNKAKLLQWVGLASSSYYYRAKGTRKGNKPSKYTFNKLQGWVE